MHELWRSESDAAWTITEPHIQAALPGGRPRATGLCAIVYLLRTGCQWRLRTMLGRADTGSPRGRLSPIGGLTDHRFAGDPI
jgi:hypothetical protein